MQATSTIERPVTPQAATSGRSFARAIEDIRQGLSQRELWAHLGWQDIKQRYRRSVLGPFWLTISMGVVSLGLALLFSLISHQNLMTFLPYVTTGLIVWNFINGCLLEGMDTFISNEGLMKHLPAPLTVYALRTVWRQTLMMLHNMIIYFIVLAITFSATDHKYTVSADGVCGQAGFTCHPGLSWVVLTAIPGFAVIAFNGVWVTLLLGIISTRYRDIPQVINSIIQLIFYLTPLIWSTDVVLTKPWYYKLIFDLNPLYHFIQIIRAPLTGQALSPWSWVVVGGVTIVGWGLALVAMRNYRARVSYWV